MIIPNFTKLPYCKFKSNIYYLCNPVLQVVVLFFFYVVFDAFFWYSFKFNDFYFFGGYSSGRLEC